MTATPRDLPQVVEVKRYLDGRVKEFTCGLVEGGERDAVLLYISGGAYDLFGLHLPAGTVTFGYYWADRDYNVYHWQRPDGESIALYFNLMDGARIAPDRLEWRDLAVDILVTPDGKVAVLDEDEFPPDAPPDAVAAVERGKATIMAESAAIAADLEARSRALWPQVFGEG